MPQKLGKGGHGQQNYVPPGDPAGGQYGDNESGSNKHFKVFKKPTNDIRKYFRKNGSWYFVKEGHLDEFIAKNPKVKLYNEQERQEFDDNKNKPKTPVNKKKYIQNLEDDIKSKVSSNCVVNFEGFDETGCKLMNESFNSVYNDFPDIGNFLTSLGTESGLNKEEQRKELQMLEEYAKNITQQEIDEYRKKLLSWNSHTDSSYWTDQKIKEILINNKKSYRGRKVLTGGTQGAFCSDGKDGKGWVKFLTTVGKKSYEEKVKKLFEENWWSSQNPNSVMTHELGHAVDYMVFNLSPYNTFNEIDIYRKKIEEIYKKEREEVQKKVQNGNWRNVSKPYGLSKYGMTNLKEFIAESFAAYYGGDNNPIANEVMSVMKEAYKANLPSIKRRGGING